MSEQWYYADGDRQNGPVPLDQLQELVRLGQLSASQMVWHEGIDQWVAAGTVAELFGAGEQPIPIAQALPLSYHGGPPIEYYNPSGSVAYGGFWLRLLAYIIDYVILWVPTHILQAGLGYAMQNSMPMTNGRGSLFFLPVVSMSGILGLVLVWLYFALMESSPTQATLGKMACGLVVTDQFGRRIGFGRATGRYFGKIISTIILDIGFIMAGFTQRKQALHDMMAGTLVIRKSLPQA